jgi:hypothetical protein
VSESVSDLADQAEIIADGLVNQAEAIGSPRPAPECAEWLIVQKQFSHFLRIIDQDRTKVTVYAAPYRAKSYGISWSADSLYP